MIKKISIVAVGAIIALAPFAAFAQTSVSGNLGTSVSGTVTPPHVINPIIIATSTRGSSVLGGKVSSTTGGTIGLGSGHTENGTRSQGDAEITARITSLNQLSANINAMAQISPSDKATIQATITSEVNTLTALKNKIDASTETVAELATDVASITSDYRVYALVLPQVRITGSVDAAFTVTSSMEQISTILQTRISQASSAGHNMAAATAALNDLNAKIADAKSQADSALAEVVNLVPDQGNQTVRASNTAALKDANSKLATISSDFTAARADISIIEKAVGGLGGSTTGGSATTTSSAAAGVSVTSSSK